MRIALIGYGKMGRQIERIALSRGHEVVCRIDIDNQADFHSPAFRSADVAIEFTCPAAAYGNILQAMEAGVKVVSGSTGWTAAHGEDARRLCTEGGKTLFWSSNFSLGVALFTAVNRHLARLMNAFPTYDVSLVETHHVHKLDAPSGTAVSLAQDIVDRLDRKQAWVKGTVHNADGTVTPAPQPQADQLPVAAIREGEVPGTHTITYASEADEIIITHLAHNRSGFALGAVLAAEYTATHCGWLGMSDLFPFLKE